MIPRSLQLVFETCETMKAKGWHYTIEVSFLEIYLEKIRDLLGPDGGTHEVKLRNGQVIVTELKVATDFY